MIFLQLFDDDTSTLTYLVADPETREAALIDPVLELVDRDIAHLQRLGLTLRYTLETHVHADHVSGGGVLRARLGSHTVMHESGGADCADIRIAHGETLALGSLVIEARHTPGHTSGCTIYVMGDRVFTGDALLIGGCGRTDFQQGDAGTLYDSIHSNVFSLPDTTLIFPGHDYKGQRATTVGWEKAHNARLGGGKSKAAFIEIMDNLKLGQPKRILEAVPANLRCGLPEAPAEALSALAVEGAGVRNLSVEQARSFLDKVRVVDVREVPERTDALGHIEGSENVPLATVLDAAKGWSTDETLLLVCRSGGRSGRATKALVDAGFANAFNMQGGMIAWNERGLPTVGAQGSH